jgi:hypothetical protein
LAILVDCLALLDVAQGDLMSHADSTVDLERAAVLLFASAVTWTTNSVLALVYATRSWGNAADKCTLRA